MSGYIGVQPVPQATQRREYFTATSGQATFNTNGYTPNYIDVYMNGVKLSPADFTASNGSDVVLASGATTGDLVQVVSFTPFNVANQTFIGDVNLSSGAYKIGGNIAINSSRAGSLTSLALTGNATFADNGKAIFGAGSDLQIYHSGAGSFISDVGNGALHIRGTNLILQNGDGTKRFLDGNDGGAVEIHHGDATNAIKLATTSTGINVTGTVTADSLTVDNSGTAITITNGDGLTQLGKMLGDATDGFVIEGKANNNLTLRTKANTAGEGIKFQDSAGDNMMFIDGTTGDISFYEDTGTTASLVWDSSQTQLKVTGRETSRGGGVYAFDVDNSTQSSNLTSAGAMRVKGYYGDSFIVNGLGDVSFFDDSGTAKFFWDASAESLGIGTSSPSASLHVSSTGGTLAIVEAPSGYNARVRISSGNAHSSFLEFADTDDSDVGEIVYDHSNNSMRFNTNGSERMRITSSGSVGIGTSSPSTALHIEGANGDLLTVKAASGSEFTMHVDGNEISLKADADNDEASSVMTFDIDGSEAMRLDASGNLLVGKTSSNVATAGHELLDYGRAIHTVNASTVQIINRLSNDGDMTIFQKDGSTVGVIGTENSHLTIGKLDTGIKFQGNEKIIPWNTSTNAIKDGQIDFGADGNRFRDLYLSGGVFLGGVGSANKLDDFEEGTWTPTIGEGTFRGLDCRYVKIGKMVYVRGYFDTFSNQTSSNNLIIQGLPFTPVSSLNAAAIPVMVRYLDFQQFAVAYITSSGHLRFYSIVDNSNYVIRNHSHLNGASASIRINGCYETAS